MNIIGNKKKIEIFPLNFLFSRVNGEAVCGDCSKGLVNKERACDVCYLKLISKEHVKELEHNLIDQENTIESFSKMIEPIQREIELLEEKIKTNHEIVIFLLKI